MQTPGGIRVLGQFPPRRFPQNQSSHQKFNTPPKLGADWPALPTASRSHLLIGCAAPCGSLKPCPSLIGQALTCALPRLGAGWDG